MTIKHPIIAATILLCSAGFGAVALTTTASAKSCVMAGGEATMVTGDLARFMANAALNNSMKARGLTPTGAVKMKCNDPSPLTYCLASQRACK